MKGLPPWQSRVELQKGEVEASSTQQSPACDAYQDYINPMMIKIIEEDIGRYQNAKNTLTDVK